MNIWQKFSKKNLSRNDTNSNAKSSILKTHCNGSSIRSRSSEDSRLETTEDDEKAKI